MTEGTAMGPGIGLAIVGAILLFAVRQGDSPPVNLHIVGLILLVAGIVVMVQARRATVSRRTVTRSEDLTDPQRPTRTVVESIQRAPEGEPELTAADFEDPAGPPPR